jgi:hypothetical protein
MQTLVVDDPRLFASQEDGMMKRRHTKQRQMTVCIGL